ncbi:MAG: hypothetical protein VZQ98_17550 [Bacteroidales bacterium]|nr:hypothetical protein [Bacteroidales bacterium]
MGVTISTHNGSAVAREHNIRNPKVVSKEAHIKPNGKFEIWYDEKPRDAYNRLFGQALEEYNNKQKRSDRKIRDYYNHICNDKMKHPVYEMIIAVGSRDNTVDEETGYSVLRAFYDGWKQRNPNLELIGAYYHADEDGVPHIHIDYVPVATGYVNGMTTQSALVKALGQQGFHKEGKATAQIKWEKRENTELEKLCNSSGIDVEHPLIEGRKHLDTERYKFQAQVQADIQEMEQKRQNAQYQTDLAEEQERIAKQKAQEEQDNLDWQREETENLILSVDKLKREEQQLKGKIDKLKKRLKNLKGEVLTAEQAKDVEINKAPLGMALLKYKDAVDLKKTAERVEEADEIEKQANQIISRKWEIIDNAEKEAKRKTQKIEKELKEKQEKLEIFSKAVDELKEKYSSLLNSEYLIRQWKIEEYKRGLENHEKLFKDTEKIKKQFEEDNDNKQSQNRSQGQGRRRR